MPNPDEPTIDQWLTDTLRPALDLDEDELAYLASVNLPAHWHARSSNASDWSWGLLALLGVVTAFVAWNIAGQPFGDLLATANAVGLSTILLTTGIGLLLDLGQALVQVSTSPVLGLTQPLLALLAVALLFWPRIRSAPHFFQGALS